MEIVPATWFQNLKKQWRRRKYRNLDKWSHDAVHTKKKIKITRFGGNKKGLVLVHVDKSTNAHIAGGKKSIPNSRPIPIVVSSTDEVEDGRSVLEIYKRVVSTRAWIGFVLLTHAIALYIYMHRFKHKFVSFDIARDVCKRVVYSSTTCFVNLTYIGRFRTY